MVVGAAVVVVGRTVVVVVVDRGTVVVVEVVVDPGTVVVTAGAVVAGAVVAGAVVAGAVVAGAVVDGWVVGVGSGVVAATMAKPTVSELSGEACLSVTPYLQSVAVAVHRSPSASPATLVIRMPIGLGYSPLVWNVEVIGAP